MFARNSGFDQMPRADVSSGLFIVAWITCSAVDFFSLRVDT